MNEWGIPDWRDKLAYGDAGAWSDMRWRWEFYRRRDDLRSDFDLLVPASVKLSAEVWGDDPKLLRPDQRGFCVRVSPSIAEKYGYPALPNPRISDQPESAILPTFRGVSITLPAQAHETATIKSGFGIEDGKATVTFDLRRPLKEQIEHASKMLKDYQIMETGGAVQRRKRRAHWLDQLRAIDGRSAGSTFQDIGETLGLSPTQPGNVARAAADTYEAGCDLRDNFPD